MKHGSLFSGIGGFDLAAQWAGWDNIFQVEIDDFCQKVLKKNFPNVKRYKDIKKFKGEKYANTIDVISGGFPCQPFSVAGKRRGKEDGRHLWPEMLRVISEIRPNWIIGENVAGFIEMGLDEAIFGLESEGYEVQSFLIPACAVNAPHRRSRVWIVGNSKHIRLNATQNDKSSNKGSDYNSERENKVCESKRPNISWADASKKSGGSACWDEPWLDVATSLCRMDDGISEGLDRVKRLKSLGNAIVPQVVFEIMRVINDIEGK